jgi:hypothetical protein
MAEAAPFFWGSSGERISPDSIKRRRAVAAAMLKNGMDYSPVQHWTQGLARVAQALVGGYEEGKLDRAEKLNTAEDAKTSAALVNQLLGGSPSSAVPAFTPAAPSMAGGSTRITFDPKLTDPLDAVAKFESGGRNIHQNVVPAGGGYNPSTGTVTGPSSASGYFQMINPTWRSAAKMAGIDTAQYPTAMSAPYEVQRAAAEALYNKEGFAPWAPYNAALRSHIQKMGGPGAFTMRTAQADLPAQNASPVAQETGQPGFAIPPEPQPVPLNGMQFNAIHANDVIPPVFQSEGIGQPWMGTALPQTPAAPTGPTMVAAPLPPSRPADLAIPQADLPAPGAVPAIGQFPTAPMEDLSNAPGAGAREGIVQALLAQQGQSAPAGVNVPPAAPTAAGAPSGPVQQVAQAMAASQPSDNALASALVSQNPALQRVAQAVLTNRLEGSRGVVMGDRLINPRTGAIIADYSQANGGRSSEFGLNPIYGVDKDGNPVVMQLGKRGDAAATKLPEGVKLARDPIKVDGPTGTTLLDPQTRQQIGFVPKDNAKAESDKVVGKAAGEATTGLPTAISQAENFLGTIDQVRKHPGRFSWGATGSSADWPIIGGGLGGTKARDFVGMVDQLKGQAFLDAFDALRGGGAISEAEGKVATQARARLDRAQTKEGFDAALSDLEGVIKRGLDVARKKAGVQPSAPSSGGVDTSKPGDYRFNPVTGKMEPA